MKRSHPDTRQFGKGHSGNDDNSSTKRQKFDRQENGRKVPAQKHSDSNKATSSLLNKGATASTLQANSQSSANKSESGDSYLKVTKAMIDFFSKSSQSLETYKKKQELRDALQAIFQDIFPYLGIYIVGSSANGFGSNKSDVDMCVMVSHEEIDQKTEAPALLTIIAKALRRASFIRGLKVIHAKVPIIKFHDVINRIECDININNHNGIRNTHLLKCYSDLDWRVRPFILSVKHWAKYHDINDAAQQSISSYSLVLMCIFYLQAVAKPAILPNLQELHPEKFNINSDITMLDLNEKFTEFKSENKQNLGELFVNFLEYYTNFDYRNNIISIRVGKLLNASDYLRRHDDISKAQWKHLCIEEPFELTNTARSVYDYYVFQRVLRVFRKSYSVIKKSKNIDDLFEEKFEIE